nr:solute carrier family 25 member 35-like isoform X3 [Cherax quadricarinatus]
MLCDIIMEFAIGAVAACGACFFSNPMDVLKTRMQLQGELKARGHYTLIYKNIIHAGIAVAKVKTHLQSQAAESIAVGHQHKHQGFMPALWGIAKKEGIRGLWRGAVSSIPRVGVGSASQLFTYSKSKDWLEQYGFYARDSWQSTFFGAMASGLVIASCMSPFDVIATRIYNQGLDTQGRGLLYKGITDCILKTLKTEGVWGFYKGWTAIYLRIGPHSFLNLIFWDLLQSLYINYKTKSHTGR